MASFDPSIILQAKPVQDPLESYGKVLSLKSLGQQQQLQEAQLTKYKQDQENEAKLNDLYKSSLGPAGTVDRNALYTGAASRGLGSRIPALQKSFADADKVAADISRTGAQTDELKFKVQKQKLDLAGGAIASLVANPNVTHDDVIVTINSLVNQGIIQPDQGAQMARMLPGNPQALRQFLIQKGLETADAGKRLDAILPKATTVNLGGTSQIVDTNSLTNPGAIGSALKHTQSPDSIASNATAIRGQNMVDARSRESASAAMTKPFEVTGQDGLPVLVQQDRQGNIVPVQGFGPKSGASKPLNDSQAKALLFGSRMQEAEKVLGSLEGKYSPAAINAKVTAENAPLIGGIAGMAGNALLSDEGQKAEQAQRDFINAVLRRESGAAISASEFENARKQYFPQPNDKPGNIAQKKANRELAIKGLLAEVPEGQRRSLSQPKQDQSAPKPGSVDGGVPDDIAAILRKHGAK